MQQHRVCVWADLSHPPVGIADAVCGGEWRVTERASHSHALAVAAAAPDPAGIAATVSAARPIYRNSDHPVGTTHTATAADCRRGDLSSYLYVADPSPPPAIRRVALLWSSPPWAPHSTHLIPSDPQNPGAYNR